MIRLYNKKLMGITLLTSLYFIISISAILTQEPQKMPEIKLECLLKADKTEWKPSENLTLRFSIKNIGNEPLRIPDITMLTRRMTELHVLCPAVIDASTGKRISPNIMWDSSGLGLDDFIIIQPAEHYEALIEPYVSYSPSLPPGEYIIYTSLRYVGEPTTPFSTGHDLGDYCKKSKIIKSNEIKITVLPYTAREKEAYDEYLEILLGKTRLDNDYVAKYGETRYMIKVCKDYIDRYPDYIFVIPIWNKLHHLYYTEGDRKQCLKVLQDMIESKITFSYGKESATILMAETYYDMDDIENAIETLRKYGSSKEHKKLLERREDELKRNKGKK